MAKRRLIVTGWAVLALVAACSNDGPGVGGPATTAPAPVTVPTTATTQAPITTAATTAAATTTAPPVTAAVPTTTETPATTDGTANTDGEEVGFGSEWVPFKLDDCRCSDGSDATFLQRDGDPSKVVLYFEGGGACFSLETCDPNDEPTYTLTTTGTPEWLAERGGLFDFDELENPLANHTWVYVPYCTGDVHLGDNTQSYGEGVDGEVVVVHHGFTNANTALEHVVASFPNADQLVVTGASAGSVPTPLIAALAADELPDADIVTFGDSSGGYPDVPAVNATVGQLWGSYNVVPDWPETAGITREQWSLPGLYVYGGRHSPRVRFGRFDYAFDKTQATFGTLAGIAADELVTLIDGTAQQAEDAGVSVASYVAAGDAHTIMGGHEFYEMTTGGVRLVDWVNQLVNGAEPPDDVHCTKCDQSVRQ